MAKVVKRVYVVQETFPELRGEKTLPTYKVVKTVNTTHPQMLSILTRTEVDNLIKAGYTVEVSCKK